MNEIKNTTLIFPILHYRVPIRDGRPARWEPSPRGGGGSPPRPVLRGGGGFPALACPAPQI